MGTGRGGETIVGPTPTGSGRGGGGEATPPVGMVTGRDGDEGGRVTKETVEVDGVTLS